MTITLKRWLFVCILTAVCLLSSSAMAESGCKFNVATVDMNEILNQLEDSKRAKADLNKASASAKEKLRKEKQKLDSLEKKLSSGKIAADSSQADDYRRAMRDFKRSVDDAEQELKRKYLLTNKKLVETVMASVKTYAKKNNIDLVLERSEAGRSAVLFGDPASDITTALLKDMNG